MSSISRRSFSSLAAAAALSGIAAPHVARGQTRPRLVEFANLAAPLRTPGPSAFGLRP